MLQLVAGVLLAAGLLGLVLRPIFRPELAGTGRRETGDVDEGDDPEDDLSPRAIAVRALKEIEFDRATGKLSDVDYEALKTKYTAEALAALRAEEAGGGKREARGLVPPPSLVSHLPRPACPTHGPRAEADAEFCSECGRRLGSAPGYCARCGTALEREARYCHSCGARVAA